MLGLQTGEIAEVPIPHNLEHPSSHNYLPIPDLVTAFYQPIVEFENFEIKLANEDIERQSEEDRPLDKLRPWSHKPFRRRTRSQNSYIHRRTKQEEFFGRKRQEEYRQIQLTGVIQTIITSQPSAQSTRPYAKYYTGFDTEAKDTSTNSDITDNNQQAISPADNTAVQQSDEQDVHIDPESVSEPTKSRPSTPVITPEKEPQILQFVDTFGQPSGMYQTPLTVPPSTPKSNRKHYYYPQIPSCSFGRGDARNLQNWLEDNPQHTESDFYWLRQNSEQIPPYSYAP